MEEHFLQTRGISYRTNTFSPDKETLVFVHGLAGNSSVWLPYEKAFEDSYNILSFDLRGHGLSSRHSGAEAFTLDYFVEDMHALLVELGVAHCVVISHSFGTVVALTFAHKYPQLVSRFLFISPPYGKTVLTSVLKNVIAFVNPALRAFPFHPHARTRVAYTTYIGTGDWNIRRMTADLRATSVHVYLYCLQNALRVSDSEWLGLISPVTIMHGTKDSIASFQNAQKLSEKIHADFVPFPKENHVFVLNHSTEVIKSIRRILLEMH